MGNVFKRRQSDDTRLPENRVIIPNHGVHPDIPNSEHPNQQYVPNKIRTTKYSLLSFIPKNLFEQFHRFANLYFLFIVLLNWVPQVNAVGKEVAMLPVIFVLLVTAVKDAFEDYRRYKSDKQINHLTCRIYSSSDERYVKTEWQEVRVGDIVHLSCNEVIPADLVVLRTSDEQGICHIDTSNLDGENNLKQREITSNINQGDFQPSQFTDRIECEPPNQSIYKFHGAMVSESGEKTPISNRNLLLRGCILRNTDYVEGIVVYAGHDTKAMMNNHGPRHKRSKLERKINSEIIWCILILFLMCLACSLGSGFWQAGYNSLNQTDVPFIPYDPDSLEQSPFYQAFIRFWTYIILFQVMIPLSLYVTIELIKIGQVYFIQNDRELYHEGTNRRVECRALNITEDLGQVQYVFSDKTGTLTENKMVFKSCSIGGLNYAYPNADESVSENPLNQTIPEQLTREAYEQDACQTRESWHDAFTPVPTLHHAISRMSLSSATGIELDVSSDTQQIQEFFLIMAICNTVVVSNHPHQDQMGENGIIQNGSNQNTRLAQLKNRIKPRVPAHLMRSTNNLSPYQTFGAQSNGVTPQCDDVSMARSDASSEVSGSTDTQTRYEAESPDELALVQAASSYGCKLLKRSPGLVSVWLPDEGEVNIKVLNILPFDSDRKRMSLIIQHPITNKIVLYCKGADSAILTNLQPHRQDDESERFTVTNTEEHLMNYARQGLRTLCMARRVIPEKEYKSWKRNHDIAESSLQDREKLLQESYCNIEVNLQLLGATGIEDRLQDGVPQTIASLRQAGIKVWVLTGDKQETAINIAYSCQLISQKQEVICLNARNREMAKDLIVNHLEQLNRRLDSQDAVRNGPHVEVRSRRSRRRRSRKSDKHQVALVIDGRTLAYIMSEDLKEDFLSLAKQCNSVLCCRATPFQKSQVVKLVRDKLKQLTLAIGDGANDVSMIQTADVGVGISGQEGMQAVMAADFSLARFRFLHRLLFVHGHWCYVRLAIMALYMWYKNAVFIFMLLWYQLYSGFSGGIPVDDFNLIAFNLIYTSVPPILLGIFDQDCPDSLLMENPGLYQQGRDSKVYKKYSYFVEILDAVWQSVAEFFIPLMVYRGSEVGNWEFGVTLNAACVYVSLLHMCIETKHWNIIHIAGLVLSLVLFFGVNLMLSFVCTFCSPPSNPYGVFIHTLSTPTHWLTVLLVIIVALAPRYIIRSLQGSFTTSDIQVIRLQYQHKVRQESDNFPYAMWSSSSSSGSVVLQHYSSTSNPAS